MPVNYANTAHRPAVEAAIFGRPATDADYVTLIGSVANKVQLTVTYHSSIASLNRSFPLHLSGRVPGEWSAQLYFDKPLVYYHSLHIDPQLRSQSVGRSLFTLQAQAARTAGFLEIEGWATRNDNPSPLWYANGYYAAARWGFDAVIPASVAAGLPAGLQHCLRVSDLMQTQPGRAHWKAHGIPLTMKFDLPMVSLSWVRLMNP